MTLAARRPRAWLAVTFAALLLASSCGRDDEPEPGEDGRSSPTAAATTGSPATPGTSPTPSPGDDPPPSDPPPARVDDLGGVGANGRAMLRGSVPQLVVEVDVQEGLDPSDGALEHLGAILYSVTDKPGGIAFAGGNTFASTRTTWSEQDLRATAAAHRTHYSAPNRATIYVLYVRGSFVENGDETDALGVAYNASEIAILPDRWSGLGALLGSSTAIERAVLTHEVGHLFGLVNLTYQSEIDHEDPDHPGHSRNERSVMYWAIDTTAIGRVFRGEPPDDFDADDLADLRGLRTGRY